MLKIVSAVTTALLLTTSAFAVDVKPRKAAEFVVQLPEGGQKLLSQYRGKVVCIGFFFTTCPHCQHAAQMLTKLQNEYGAKGFQVLAVAFNPMAKMLVPDFVRDYKIGFPVGYSEREPVNSFLENPPENALHVPQLVFVDKKGMVRNQSLTRNDSETAVEANVRSVVEKLLAEPNTMSSGAKPAAPAAKKKSS